MKQRIFPGSNIGILGGGQLGKMLCLAAQRLGYKVHIYSDNQGNPAIPISDSYTIGSFNDLSKIKKFSENCTLVTFETENIPGEALKTVSKYADIAPNIKSLQITQDRLQEKKFLGDNNIKTANFLELKNDTDLKKIKNYNIPSIIKTNRFGYDGKGQRHFKNYEELIICWDSLNRKDCIIEEKINFKSEISILLARNQNAEIEFYDPTLNTHKNGILEFSQVPATIDSDIVFEAKKISAIIANSLQHVGVLCIEMFLAENDDLLVNEIAPRVHNSGHWTLDGSNTDQFEQHIRCICGLKLGNSYRHSDVKMQNLLGKEILEAEKKLADSDFKLHVYGKKEIKENRKMGHISYLSNKTPNK